MLIQTNLFRFEDLGHIQKKHQGFIEQLRKFIDDFDVEPLEVECTAWNETVGYAGTIDLIARVGGETVILDIKTEPKLDGTVDRKVYAKPIKLERAQASISNAS